MGLRTRLWVAMMVSAVVPLAGAGWGARRAVVRRFEEEDQRRREAAVARVERSLEGRANAQARSLRRFCAHDYLVDRALVQLGSGAPAEGSQDALTLVWPEVQTALGFDTLSMVSQEGRVLASAHYPGRVGSLDLATFEVASRARASAWVRAVRVREGQAPHDRLVLESACVRSRGPVAVAVSGGVALDAQRFDEAAQDEGVRVRLVLAPSEMPGSSSQRVVSLRGADGRPVASVLIERDDKPLRRLLSTVDALLAVAALAAAVVAAAVAAAFATRLARPIRRVAEAADKIAAGDRMVELDVQASAEVGRMVAAFNAMVRSLNSAEKRVRRAERLAAWRDIARQMAHEIKNPLTPIRMGIERLRKLHGRNVEDFAARFVEETDVILEEVERLRRLVEDFSRFARMPRPKLGAVRLHELLAHVVDLHANESVSLAWVEEGCAVATMPPLRADRDQLTQVLVNLVSNATWAAESRAGQDPGRGPGRVRLVVTQPESTRVRVSVEDNGAGIDPDVMLRLFEPYVTRRPGGTGLGLAIAYRIAVDHGGALTAHSSPEGARFVLELPFQGPAAVGLDTQNDELG
ncbi:MAG: HAMP domain-containing protein [Myxococcales bacterium]|nr:HAMP domain-containing protein [Myxococcales bacterium]